MSVFYERSFRVDSRDVDPFNQCRPSALLGYLQEAATEAACALHVSREEMIDKYHVFWMLARMWYRLDRPLFWDDTVTIRTWHRGDKGASMYRDFDLFRDGELRQLTTDHCKSQRLIAMGVLTEEQARKHPSKHELTQHLGIFEEEMIIEPEFGEALTLQPGDEFLLCSDGLTDMVEDRDIAALLGANETPYAQADALLHTALENGGRDNVTILVLRVDRKPLLQRVLNGLRKQEGQA